METGGLVQSEVPGPQLHVRKRGSEGGSGGLVYVGPVHGRHVVIRLVQCLGSFVHLEKNEMSSVSDHIADLKTWICFLEMALDVVR